MGRMQRYTADGLVAEDFIQRAAGPQGREGLRVTVATLDHDLDHPTATIHRVLAQGDVVVVHLSLPRRCWPPRTGRRLASASLVGSSHLPPSGRVAPAPAVAGDEQIRLRRTPCGCLVQGDGTPVPGPVLHDRVDDA